MAYTYTFTVTDDSPQALNFVKFIKSLDFIQLTRKKKKAPTIVEEELEEDEYGIPIKDREEIMAMSKQSNRNMTKRWEAAIAAKEKEQKL